MTATTKTPSRIEIVMQTVRSRIAARQYVPGARLPSVRAQATAMNCSVSTVVEAYERLVAEGVVKARAGSGFYVVGVIAPLDLSELGPRLDREIDPLWLSSQSLETNATTLKPGCGWLPPSWMYEEGMRRALRYMARGEASSLVDYGTPQGLPALRQVLARRMAGLSIEATPEQVMLVDSSTQAIDLICRFLLEAGDTVVVDDPCYFNFHALLRAHRVNVVGVPYTPHGPDVAVFKQIIEQHKPRLYITNSGIHNPTGSVLSSVTAHRILQLAEHANLTIVEDDLFADFEWQPAPRLAAFDGLDRVIHIGSFSKTLSAALRCGYIAAKPEWISGLTDLRIATSFGGGRLAAEVTLHVLTGSGYRRHMETVRTRLAQALERLLPRLRKLGIEPWLVPQAGIFVWCRLPDGADATRMARYCLQHDVVLAPGNAFSQSHQAEDFLRFNIAQADDPRLFEVLAKALRH
ncbi:PLP-dependent aminotransferase family protein [Paenalcaligenes sp. Me52]|uniref:aminotransferase-like domain-containing protein n=1 Tax=Paenalcaligenes sp. Me52 TaxID=3392038 RepID=UPI003D28F5B2